MGLTLIKNKSFVKKQGDTCVVLPTTTNGRPFRPDAWTPIRRHFVIPHPLPSPLPFSQKTGGFGVLYLGTSICMHACMYAPLSFLLAFFLSFFLSMRLQLMPDNNWQYTLYAHHDL